MTARAVCCGCGTDMGTREGFCPDPDDPGREIVSHGLCPACIDKQMAELGLQKEVPV